MKTSTAILIVGGVIVVIAVAFGIASMSRDKGAVQEPGMVQENSAVSRSGNPSRGNTEAPAGDIVLTQQQAEQLAAKSWNVNLAPSEGPAPVITTTKNDNGTYTVVAIASAMDDSIAKNRYEGTATYVGGTWMLSTPVKTWSCQPNRGHQDYTTAACM